MSDNILVKIKLYRKNEIKKLSKNILVKDYYRAQKGVQISDKSTLADWQQLLEDTLKYARLELPVSGKYCIRNFRMYDYVAETYVDAEFCDFDRNWESNKGYKAEFILEETEDEIEKQVQENKEGIKKLQTIVEELAVSMLANQVHQMSYSVPRKRSKVAGKVPQKQSFVEEQEFKQEREESKPKVKPEPVVAPMDEHKREQFVEDREISERKDEKLDEIFDDGDETIDQLGKNETQETDTTMVQQPMKLARQKSLPKGGRIHIENETPTPFGIRLRSTTNQASVIDDEDKTHIQNAAEKTPKPSLPPRPTSHTEFKKTPEATVQKYTRPRNVFDRFFLSKTRLIGKQNAKSHSNAPNSSHASATHALIPFSKNALEVKSTGNPTKSILLLGENGVGKTTFINVFHMNNQFSSFNQALASDPTFVVPQKITTSVNYQTTYLEIGDARELPPEDIATKIPQTYEFDVNDETFLFIDTPGLEDDQNREVVQDFLYDFPTESIDLICVFLVANEARALPQFKQCMTNCLLLLDKNFDDAKNKIVFIFTKARPARYSPGDSLGKLRKFLVEYEKNVPEDQAKFKLEEDGERIYWIENEPFRYLWERYRNMSDMDDDERQEFEKHCNASWENNKEAIAKLMGYLANL